MRGLLHKVIGDANQREIARLQKVVARINALEPYFQALDDAQLRAKTDEFRRRLEQGETLDDLLVEAFAAVREAARRTIGLRPYDVQLIGGIVLHQGRIVEMKTGEGKTLVATLPLYLNALEGKGAHLVTPNDYLSKVGVQWMGPIYHALGLKVGVIQSAAADPDRNSFVFDPDYPSADDRFLNLRPVSRREAYLADITYGTNNEFGFDYLRDNMARDLSDCVQRELHYAIVDEVDNILIDEARTPLIISGPAEESSELYQRCAEIVRRLRPSSPESVRQEQPDGDYVVEEKTQVVTLTEQGVERVERMLQIGPGESIYDPQHAHILPYLDNALRAHAIYKRDRDYIVKDGEVIIVDEFTGRLMYGRRFSEGLHQAIEAKERVPVQRESLTYATITFQNYFRMYKKLAGMTGTAKTEEEEFRSIYNLDVVVLPTNVEYRAMYGDLVARERRLDEIQEVTFAGILDGHHNSLGDFGGPVTVTTYEPHDGNGRRYFKRLDLRDVVYRTEQAKFRAIVEEIKALHRAGRPVLVGTIAIETSEKLSRMIKRHGIPHQVLNAKYHEQEAVIIAQAGRSGTVTIATNMAGRGVDIKLGGDPEGVARERLRRAGFDLTTIPQAEWNDALELLRRGEDPRQAYPTEWATALAEAFADCQADHKRVVALGGLHIIGTERHEARRIDNQLRGRAGRQGDPGSSRFYISLEDELMRRFGGERVQALMERFGVDENVPLQHPWLDKTIESAQMRVEGYNFDIRKHVLEYDDVVNKQREVIYAQRRQVLSATSLREQVLRMVREEIGRVIAAHTRGLDPEEWDWRGLYTELRSFLPLPRDLDYHQWADYTPEELEAHLFEFAEQEYDKLNRAIGQQIYQHARQGDLTLQAMAASADPALRLVYQRLSERLGGEPDAEIASRPLRRLPEEMKPLVEEAFVEAYTLFRDRQIMLHAVDTLWVHHLTDLDVLREGIGLRAYGQQNPLVAYRKEAYEMYEALLARIQETIARSIFLLPQPIHSTSQRPAHRPQPTARLTSSSHQGGARGESPEAQPTRPVAGRSPQPAPEQLPGRNAPCWCGSGKKYKHCHLREDELARPSPTPSHSPKATGRPRRRR
ncbi:MAG: SEC-C metal-binding domain-containing protein [Anaerolineae bacterium]|nr:SEC-C metal-binding domain-containing protein [Anaerolineae bacterium]